MVSDYAYNVFPFDLSQLMAWLSETEGSQEAQHVPVQPVPNEVSAKLPDSTLRTDTPQHFPPHTVIEGEMDDSGKHVSL